MQRSRLVYAALLSSLLYLGASHRHVHACSCPFDSGRDLLDRSELAFRGKVFRINAPKSNPFPGERYPLRIDFDVIASYRGVQHPIVSVWTYGADGTNCGVNILLGEDMLVFARSFAERELANMSYSSGCWMRRFDSESGRRILGDIGSGEPVSHICPRFSNVVSEGERTRAMENPRLYWGWGQALNPNKPPSPFNPWRVWLEPRNPAMRISPYNNLLWKAGCS